MSTCAVAEAVKEVYEAFADERAPTAIDACPCGHGKEPLCKLVSTSLRSIRPELLSKYSGSVFFTCGSEQDFKYLLPRILEIVTDDLAFGMGPEVTVGKLALAHWEKWPARQRSAVLGLLTALFERALKDSDDAGWALDSLLCAYARVGMNVMPFLERLLQPEHGPKLITLYETHSSTLNTKGRLSNPFWKEAPESTRFEVVSWLRSERVDKKLWEAYEARAQNAG